jgi:uncharacterized BrkB/YihY/UPF0761 family membrane protein
MEYLRNYQCCHRFHYDFGSLYEKSKNACWRLRFRFCSKEGEAETLNRFIRDRRGVLYVYLVLAICLAAGIFFGFLMMNVVEKVQDAINPLIDYDQWATDAHYDTFYLAASFVTNVWTYIIALIVFVLAYWGYTYSQRRTYG